MQHLYNSNKATLEKQLNLYGGKMWIQVLLIQPYMKSVDIKDPSRTVERYIKLQRKTHMCTFRGTYGHLFWRCIYYHALSAIILYNIRQSLIEIQTELRGWQINITKWPSRIDMREMRACNQHWKFNLNPNITDIPLSRYNYIFLGNYFYILSEYKLYIFKTSLVACIRKFANGTCLYSEIIFNQGLVSSLQKYINMKIDECMRTLNML